MTDAKPRKPFFAKCEACGHCWPVAYLPMEVTLFAKIAKSGAICPNCGASGRRIVVAKQDDGVLLEEGVKP